MKCKFCYKESDEVYWAESSRNVDGKKILHRRICPLCKQSNESEEMIERSPT